MPYPKAGESEQGFVRRFMDSDEARADFPDIKQRAAVAYSMFKENRNGPEICADCGSGMKPAPGRDSGWLCGGCGQLALNVAANKDMAQTCAACLHDAAGHDAMGCGEKDCTCVQGVSSEDAKPKLNAPDASAADAYASHQLACPDCANADDRGAHCVAGKPLLDAAVREQAEKGNAVPPGPKSDEPLRDATVKDAHRTAPEGYPHEAEDYADPKNKKYPIDTPEHVRAALSYLGHAKDSGEYTGAELETMRARIARAAGRLGVSDSEKQNSSRFETSVDPIPQSESEGKWDYKVTVKRLSDGKTLTDKVSGGQSTADAAANRLKGQLENDGEDQNPDPSAAFESHCGGCPVCEVGGNDLDALCEVGRALIESSVEDEGFPNANPSKRKCPLCNFTGSPSDVVEHLKRRHGKSDDEAHDLVGAPDVDNAGDGEDAANPPSDAPRILELGNSFSARLALGEELYGRRW